MITNIDHRMRENICSVIDKFEPDWEITIIDSDEKCLDENKNGNQYDIVILGVGLSDKSSLELICRIRDDSDIPVVVLSNYIDIKMLVKAFNAGANEFLTSPFNKDVFIARLKALVRRRIWDNKAKEDKLGRI